MNVIGVIKFLLVIGHHSTRTIDPLSLETNIKLFLHYT